MTAHVSVEMKVVSKVVWMDRTKVDWLAELKEMMLVDCVADKLDFEWVYETAGMRVATSVFSTESILVVLLGL
jgi:hypothetical protein